MCRTVKQRKCRFRTPIPTIPPPTTHTRSPLPYRPVEERVGDWKEVHARLPAEEHAELLNTQAARCMNCGTPYCLNKATGEGGWQQV